MHPMMNIELAEQRRQELRSAAGRRRPTPDTTRGGRGRPRPPDPDVRDRS